jgi:hypothetical protein
VASAEISPLQNSTLFSFDSDYMTYAVPDHPEYRRYRVRDFLVIYPAVVLWRQVTEPRMNANRRELQNRRDTLFDRVVSIRHQGCGELIAGEKLHKACGVSVDMNRW